MNLSPGPSPERGGGQPFDEIFEAASPQKSRIPGFSVGGLGLFLLFLLAACAPASPAPQQTDVALAVAATLTFIPLKPAVTSTPPPVATRKMTATTAPSATPGPTDTPTPDTRLDPKTWNTWPVVPTVSRRAKEIYLAGIAQGNDPHSFSTIGDCQSEPNVFLGIYDTNRYILVKDDQFLQETVDFYKGIFGRQSLAVRDGLSAPSALSAQWANADRCQTNENPVQCELRTHKPAVMFINLGTNWRPDASVDAYEKYLRQIVELVIANGSVPVLSTKADDVEGGNRINLATVRVAHDYDVPLWNFWVTAQYLPNHGLDKSRKDVYLSVEAWDARSYGGLKVLDHLRREFATVYPLKGREAQ
jgi:hypothetical protein